MRTFFKCGIAALTLVMITSFGDVLISSRLLLDAPRVHVIQEGEYLSDLAERYYGDSDYWRELALVNRAPDPNRVFPGEQVILPSAAAIGKIKQSGRLSAVNQIVNGQEALAVLESEAEKLEFSRKKAGLAAKGGTVPAQISSSQEQETSGAASQGEAPVRQALVAAEEPAAGEPEVAQEPAEELVPVAFEPERQDAGSGWMLPAAVTSGVVFLGLGYVLYRRRSSEKDQPEIDASPIDPFVLAAEKSEKRSSDETTDVLTDELFRPTKPKQGSDKEKVAI